MLWNVEWVRGWDKWDPTKDEETNNIVAVVDEYDRRFYGIITKRKTEDSDYILFGEIWIVDERYPGIIYSGIRMNEITQQMRLRKIKHQFRLLLCMFASKYVNRNGIVRTKIGKFDFYYN